MLNIETYSSSRYEHLTEKSLNEDAQIPFLSNLKLNTIRSIITVHQVNEEMEEAWSSIKVSECRGFKSRIFHTQ